MKMARFSPFGIAAPITAGDTHHRGVAIILHKIVILAVEVSIVFGSHVIATAPVFVANHPEGNRPCFFLPMLATQVRERTAYVRSEVLDLIAHFL